VLSAGHAPARGPQPAPNWLASITCLRLALSSPGVAWPGRRACPDSFRRRPTQLVLGGAVYGTEFFSACRVCGRDSLRAWFMSFREHEHYH